MKLITKTILYFILVSIPLLILVGLVSFHLITEAVDENISEGMWSEKEKCERLIDGFDQPKSIIISLDSLSSIQIVDSKLTGDSSLVRVMFDAVAEEFIQYRVLKSYYKNKGVNYLITLVKPMLEEDDLIENLISSLLLMFILLIFGFFIANWILAKQLWQPFHKTIQILNSFNIHSSAKVNFEDTSTTEFKKLNQSLQKMTDKLQMDFKMQKEFTENASHEMQTPLAIIKAKLESLMQSPQFKREELMELLSIESSVNKLSSLNKSLLLLAQIENNQYIETKEVNIAEVIEKILINYEDFILEKKLNVEKSINTEANINMNKTLLELLIGNLVQNAIRHNNKEGMIKVELSTNYLIVSNTGPELEIDKSLLFERFKKGSAKKESIGLGLAIVKSILNTYNYTIEYNREKEWHQFKIKF